MVLIFKASKPIKSEWLFIVKPSTMRSVSKFFSETKSTSLNRKRCSLFSFTIQTSFKISTATYLIVLNLLKSSKTYVVVLELS